MKKIRSFTCAECGFVFEIDVNISKHWRDRDSSVPCLMPNDYCGDKVKNKVVKINEMRAVCDFPNPSNLTGLDRY